MTVFDPSLPIVVGNWKQNTGRAEAEALARAVVAEAVPGTQRAVCPPAIWLTTVEAALAGSDVLLGAQTVSRYPDGAYTGEVSAAMVAEVCAFAIVGHSERRRHFANTDPVVNEKVRLALAAGLGVVLCVGESLEQRDAGSAEEVVVGQLRRGLEGVPAGADVVVAYEPVWAIGTGRSASAADAEAMSAAVASETASLLGAPSPVLYGGSVTPANAAELFAGPSVSGFLVGGASLKADQFTAIARAVSK